MSLAGIRANILSKSLTVAKMTKIVPDLGMLADTASTEKTDDGRHSHIAVEAVKLIDDIGRINGGPARRKTRIFGAPRGRSVSRNFFSATLMSSA